MESRNPFFNSDTEEQLPPETLEFIYEKLDSDGLHTLAQSCRFFSDSLQLYKSPEFIKRNLKNSNYEKRIINGQDEKITALAGWRNLIIAASFNRVQAYDANTGEIVWTFTGKSVLHDPLSIVDGKVVCIGFEIINGSYQHNGNTIISILEVETGNLLQTIRHPQLQSNLITISGNHVFGKLDKGNLACANSSGKIKMYSSHVESSHILANEHYIVDMYRRHTGLCIINRETGESGIININLKTNAHYEGIYCTTITNNMLICGMVESSFDLLFIDMQKCEIIKEYKTETPFLQNYPTCGGFQNFPGIHSVVANNQYAFMAHECGMVVAVNLIDYSSVVLEQALTPHSLRLSLQGNYLFVTSIKKFDVPSSLHIWDVDSMTKINSFQISGLDDALLWHKGQLFIASEKSLIKYDFKIQHKGVSLANGSPEHVEEEDRSRECIIS